MRHQFADEELASSTNINLNSSTLSNTTTASINTTSLHTATSNDTLPLNSPDFIRRCDAQFKATYFALSNKNEISNSLPPCCNALRNDKSSRDASWSSLSSVIRGTGSVSYITRTEAVITVSTYVSWLECEASRTVTGEAWTWYDGYPRVNWWLVPDECSGPSMVSLFESLTTITETLTPEAPPLPYHEALAMSAEAACDPRCGTCYVMNDFSVDLLYWPVSLTFSNNSIATVPPTEPGIITAVYGTTTLTSPTVYLSFGTLYAEQGGWLRDGCISSSLGRRYSNIIWPVPMGQSLNSWEWISSSIPWPPEFRSQLPSIAPLDYADFSPNHVAASKWLGACAFNDFFNAKMDCSTITEGLFPPLLEPPLQLRSFDPAWARCEVTAENMLVFGLLDPPITLKPARPPLSIPAATTTFLEPLPTLPSPGGTTRNTMFVPITKTALQVPRPTPAPKNFNHNSPIGSSGPKISSDPDVDGDSSGHADSHSKDPSIADDKTHSPLPSAVITINSEAYTVYQSKPLIISSQTLLPDGEPLIISYHTIAFGINGIIINGIVTPFSAQVTGGPSMVDEGDIEAIFAPLPIPKEIVQTDIPTAVDVSYNKPSTISSDGFQIGAKLMDIGSRVSAQVAHETISSRNEAVAIRLNTNLQSITIGFVLLLLI